MVKPTTVYIDSQLLQAVKLKAVHSRSSVSRLVNEALKMALREDSSDLKALKARKSEPSRTFDEVLKSLKKDGLI